MKCKDNKITECPSTKPAYCDRIEGMAWPEMCLRCKTNDTRTKQRIERAKNRKKGLPNPVNENKNQSTSLPRQLSEEILWYCGKECGGPPGKDCAVTPCAIRGGRVLTCPLDLWTIQGDKMITKETL